MIKSVTVINYLGETLKMELMRPEKTGFYIQKIDGLGPCKASIGVLDNATNDGARFSSARVGTRNIVMYLGFLFSHNIEELRHKSYKYFPLKKPVTIIIETDRRICETYGYVESNQPDIFSNNETTQISIVCPDPYFYSSGSEGVTVTVFSGIDPLFTFPFSNESFTDNTLVFGEIHNYTEQTVLYAGDSEVGVDIHIHAIGPAYNVAIHNLTTKEVMRIDSEKLAELADVEIIEGDDIFISTSKGAKSIYLLRDGSYINILNCLGKYTDWFTLAKGDNIFAYTADEGVNNLQFRIENKTAYEGV